MCEGTVSEKSGAVAAPVLQMFGKTKNEAIDQIYFDTIENLRGLIDSEYPSIKNFCETHGIDRFNLHKIFANKYDKEMR